MTGALDATATASWEKTISDLVAHVDATISGQASGSQILGQQPQEPSQPASNATAASAIPMQGEIHATYSARDKRLALNKSTLRTPQTNLGLDGVVSNASRLNLQLQANDLHEVEEIADLFRRLQVANSLHSLGLAGTATFHGNVQGSTSAPHLTGQLRCTEPSAEWNIVEGL